jgi:hypothetical protein
VLESKLFTGRSGSRPRESRAGLAFDSLVFLGLRAQGLRLGLTIRAGIVALRLEQTRGQHPRALLQQIPSFRQTRVWMKLLFLKLKKTKK